MKRRLFFISSLLFLTIDLFAQAPTFTSGFNPYVGFSIISQPAYFLGVIPNTGDTAQIWNYSALQDSGGIDSETYVAPSSTPYGSSFPTSNMVLESPGANGGEFYNYYVANSTEFELVGIVDSGNFTIPYTNPFVEWSYPFSYGTIQTGTFSASYTDSGITDTRTGTDTFNVNGYGTLILPNVLYTNVLCVSLTQYYHDSYSDGATALEIINSINYIIPGYQAPLLSITHNSFYEDGLYVVSGYTVSFDPDTLTGINKINPLVENLNVFPNPSYSQATISLSLKEASTVNVYVTDILGRKVKNITSGQVEAGYQTYSFEASDLSKGLYTVTVEINGSIAAVHKLVVQ